MAVSARIPEFAMSSLVEEMSNLPYWYIFYLFYLALSLAHPGAIQGLFDLIISQIWMER